MILSEDQEAKLYELATVTGIDIEELRKSLTVIAEGAINIWNRIKELSEAMIKGIEFYLHEDVKPYWNTHKKLVMKSQVLNRKPLMARARSTC
jgi:uncharacterized membrane protein